jgi:hypothetical protein
MPSHRVTGDGRLIAAAPAGEFVVEGWMARRPAKFFPRLDGDAALIEQTTSAK